MGVATSPPLSCAMPVALLPLLALATQAKFFKTAAPLVVVFKIRILNKDKNQGAREDFVKRSFS